MTALFPDVIWAVGPAHVVGIVVAAAVGLASHEAMHLGVLEALREPYDVSLAPAGWRRGLTRGALVDISMQRPAPRARVAAVMLAPLVATAPPFVAWVTAFTYPAVEVGTLLVLGAWFAFAIPSPQDLATVAFYDPDEAVPTEVSA